MLDHGEREGQQRAVADGQQRLGRGGAVERVQPGAGVAGQNDRLRRWPPHGCRLRAAPVGCGRRLPLTLPLMLRLLCAEPRQASGDGCADCSAHVSCRLRCWLASVLKGSAAGGSTDALCNQAHTTASGRLQLQSVVRATEMVLRRVSQRQAALIAAAVDPAFGRSLRKVASPTVTPRSCAGSHAHAM